MGAVTVIGLDIAKSVFQAHGIDAAGTIVIQRQIRRGQVLTFFASLPPCLIGIEACAPPIIGRASCSSWVTKCGSCRRPMSSPM
jgi:hypothetical protein